MYYDLRWHWRICGLTLLKSNTSMTRITSLVFRPPPTSSLHSMRTRKQLLTRYNYATSRSDPFKLEASIKWTPFNLLSNTCITKTSFTTLVWTYLLACWANLERLKRYSGTTWRLQNLIELLSRQLVMTWTWWPLSKWRSSCRYSCWKTGTVAI